MAKSASTKPVVSKKSAKKGKTSATSGNSKFSSPKKVVAKKSSSSKKASEKLATAKEKVCMYKKLGPKDVLDRKIFKRKGFAPMSEEQVQKLKEAEKMTKGKKLDEIEEVSCGSIVVNVDKKGVARILVITTVNGDTKSGYCCLPKGHINPGETEINCACRETNEETGTSLTAKNVVIGKDGQPITGWKGYSFVSNLHRDHWEMHDAYPDESKRPILINHKKVHFFLTSVSSLALKKTIGEDAKNVCSFLEVQEALARLPYDEDKATIRDFLQRGNIKY
jgi:8-oxo-dGTP pyrophosphatase MutT (NUDIX family)